MNKREDIWLINFLDIWEIEMNGRGAIVIQKPPTFLESLLSGMGIGISQGLDRYFDESSS